MKKYLLLLMAIPTCLYAEPYNVNGYPLSSFTVANAVPELAIKYEVSINNTVIDQGVLPPAPDRSNPKQIIIKVNKTFRAGDNLTWTLTDNSNPVNYCKLSATFTATPSFASGAPHQSVTSSSGDFYFLGRYPQIVCTGLLGGGFYRDHWEVGASLGRAPSFKEFSFQAPLSN